AALPSLSAPKGTRVTETAFAECTQAAPKNTPAITIPTNLRVFISKSLCINECCNMFNQSIQFEPI
ncbi:MAG: hypothetical protein ACI9X0_002918, partial [Kiritimatiellia bacterium]